MFQRGEKELIRVITYDNMDVNQEDEPHPDNRDVGHWQAILEINADLARILRESVGSGFPQPACPRIRSLIASSVFAMDLLGDDTRSLTAAESPHFSQASSSFSVHIVLTHELGDQLCAFITFVRGVHSTAGSTLSPSNSNIDCRVGLPTSLFIASPVIAAILIAITNQTLCKNLRQAQACTPPVVDPFDRLGWFGKWIPGLNDAQLHPDWLHASRCLELRATPSAAFVSDNALVQKFHVHVTAKQMGKWKLRPDTALACCDPSSGWQRLRFLRLRVSILSLPS